MSVRLSLPGFAKKPLVFKHDKAVGHSGQVITNGAVQTGPADAAPRAFADFTRMREKILEKPLQDFSRPPVRLMDDGIVIQIFVKVFAQFKVQHAAVGAVLHQHPGKTPGVIGRMDRSSFDRSSRTDGARKLALGSMAIVAITCSR